MSKAISAARFDADSENSLSVIDALLFSLCILGCALAVGCWLANYATTLG